MKKVGSTRRHHTEKTIIDALLKISEIVQKTETSRQTKNVNKNSKKAIGDGDYKGLYNNEKEDQQVPVPPPMRTLDSYVSEFNQPSNCNQTSNQYERNVLQDFEKRNDRSYKRHYSDTSCSSNNDVNQERSLKRRFSSSSFQSDKTSQPVCEELKTVDNQPTITSINSPTMTNQVKSISTTIIDDQSSYSLSIPVLSATVKQGEPAFMSSSNNLNDQKEDLNKVMDKQLQATLEKRLRDHLLSSTSIRNQSKTPPITLTKSETGKLMNAIHSNKQTCDLEHYNKQRELAMVAVQQSNYSLSYNIYTNLLHENRYDYKLKSDILASRATSLLLEQKYFESIEDCTQAIVFNQWNKLAYVVRAACWMIKHEYVKAVEDYSKLFHFFDQSQYVLDLLNIAFEKSKQLKNDNNPITPKMELENKNLSSMTNIKSSIDTDIHNPTKSLSLASPTASFIQPAVYLCYPYQAYPTWYTNNNEEPIQYSHEIKQISSNNNAYLSSFEPKSDIEGQSLFEIENSRFNTQKRRNLY
ncbi:hypothetical protein I4U23_020528 [Adineta vaga]|nr:hypothetical protein I4U23_020528 [Adineta vaga]